MSKASDIRGKAIARKIIVEVAEEMLKNGITKAVVAKNMRLTLEEVKQIANKIK